MDISVIFVSFNTKYFLEQAINSVISAQHNFSLEIIVIDNASSDDTVDYLNSHIDFPLTIISNETNIGFAAANNIGINRANGKYILFLNPDTIIQKDTLSVCYNLAETQSKVGAIGVRMVDGSGNYLPESKRAIPTPTNSFWKLSGFSSVFPKSKLFSSYNLGNIKEDEDSLVEVLCGAFMFMPRSLLQEIGGFDEDYFMYGEDIDLSYKVQKSGHQIYYLGSHTIIHYKGQSTQKSSLDYVNTFYSAMSTFAKKHYGASGLLVFLLSIGIYLRRIGSIGKRVAKHFVFILVDLVLFISGFLLIKNIWAKYRFGDADYYSDSNITLNIFIYVIVWISSLYLLRSYKRYHSRSLFLFGVLLGLLLVLVAYSLFPESYRSSRAIILFGAIWIFISGWISRTVFSIGSNRNTTVTKRIGIVGDEQEYSRATEIINRVLGDQVYVHHISPLNLTTEKILAEQKFNQLNEIVFCLKDVPIERVLNIMTENMKGISYKLFGDRSLSIIGSRKSNELGEVYGINIQYQIETEDNVYYKRLVDIVIGLVLMLAFPFLIFFSGFREHIKIGKLLQTVWGSLSLVGYNANDTQLESLPKIKSGLITCNSSHDAVTSHQLNTAYALQYSPWRDIVLLFNRIF